MSCTPHLQEVYVLIYTNNMLHLSWQATTFAPHYLKLLREWLILDLGIVHIPSSTLLDVEGILDNFIMCLYVGPLNRTMPFLSSLLLPSDILALWALLKHLRVKSHA